jgi:deoxyribonuclease IV
MASDKPRFGPAGNSDSFYAQGHKHSVEMPKWLSELGLDAYEYSFGRGVVLSSAKAAEIGAEAKKYNIATSVHAPYYINFANESEESRAKSRQYLLDSAKVAAAMGAARVVFHSGACTGKDRAEALRLTLSELEKVVRALEDAGIDAVTLCPETMGKPNQQGTLDEVLEMCSVNPSVFLPAVDFGHINALGHGSLKTKEDYERIVDAIEAKLGSKAAGRIHVHFSHIEYGKAGEVKHLTLEDEVFGPEFAPLAEVMRERAMHPVVICESRDVMAEDALKLKLLYENTSC